MSFDLSDMEGELRHDRYTGLLLADHMQDVGVTTPNMEKAIAQAPNLRAGFGDCRHSGFHAPRDDITIMAIRRKIGALHIPYNLRGVVVY